MSLAYYEIVYLYSACASLLHHNVSLVYNCRSERRPQNKYSNKELLVYATTAVGSDSSASIINTPHPHSHHRECAAPPHVVMENVPAIVRFRREHNTVPVCF